MLACHRYVRVMLKLYQPHTRRYLLDFVFFFFLTLLFVQTESKLEAVKLSYEELNKELIADMARLFEERMYIMEPLLANVSSNLYGRWVI